MEILFLGPPNLPLPWFGQQGQATQARTLPALSAAWGAGLTAFPVSGLKGHLPAALKTGIRPLGLLPSGALHAPGSQLLYAPSLSSASFLGGSLKASLVLGKGKACVCPRAGQLWFESQLCHFIAV